MFELLGGVNTNQINEYWHNNIYVRCKPKPDTKVKLKTVRVSQLAIYFFRENVYSNIMHDYEIKFWKKNMGSYQSLSLTGAHDRLIRMIESSLTGYKESQELV